MCGSVALARHCFTDGPGGVDVGRKRNQRCAVVMVAEIVAVERVREVLWWLLKLYG